MSMKKTILILLLAFAGWSLEAQDGYELVDSVYRAPAALLDSANFGRSIFSALPPTVRVNQSASLRSDFEATVGSNGSRKLNGYRIRVFFDNSQSARGASEAVAAGFRHSYPGIGVYRTYESPFFRVTVGNFRTRSEAFAFLQRIKGSYPGAFIMKCPIDYPPVNPEKPFVQDTVTLLRRTN